MSQKRRGLGRGLGALIPTGSSGSERPVDVFFPGRPAAAPSEVEPSAETPDDSGEATNVTDLAAEAQAPGVRSNVPATAGGPPTDIAKHSPEHGSVVAAASASAASTGSAGSPADPVMDRAAEDGLLPVPGASFAEIPVADIAPNPKQPRAVFDEEDLAELTGSVQEIGVLQPVVVRRSAEPHAPRFELIMGERRWRATQAAGLATIPAIIRETEDADLLRDALLENLHRAQLNPLEEAAAYQQLLDDFGCTQEELARRIHRSRPQISNTLRLLRLPPTVQRRVAAGVLSAGHARALLGLPDAESMERLATRIVAEGLSVRATEEAVTLWDGAPAPRRATAPRAGDRVEALDEFAGRLGDALDTRVKVQLGKTKGKVMIEFASVQDLNRIISVLRPEDPGVLR